MLGLSDQTLVRQGKVETDVYKTCTSTCNRSPFHTDCIAPSSLQHFSNDISVIFIFSKESLTSIQTHVYMTFLRAFVRELNKILLHTICTLETHVLLHGQFINMQEDTSCKKQCKKSSSYICIYIYLYT